MSTYQSPLAVIVKGAIAGAAGTAVMGVAMEQLPSLLAQYGIRLPPEGPGPAEPDTPTEEMAERVVEGVAHQPLDEEVKPLAGQAVHWAYGAAWGAAYGVMQSTLKLPHLVHGTLFGALVGVVAETVVPAMRLQRSPATNPPQINALHFGSHIIFGWATALTYAILNLGRRG
jgi:putative membrane protein